jgi:hypothetical protein
MKRLGVLVMMAMSFVGGILLAFLGCIAMSPVSVVGQLDAVGAAAETVRTLTVDCAQPAPPSSAEVTFENTLRSCLSPKCYDKPMGKGNDIYRVGLLSLPGTGSEILKSINLASEMPANHYLVHDTHVPAYGYGKNHGWTRIVHFARNILDHAFFLVAEKAEAGEMELQTAYENQVTGPSYMLAC